MLYAACHYIGWSLPQSASPSTTARRLRRALCSVGGPASNKVDETDGSH